MTKHKKGHAHARGPDDLRRDARQAGAGFGMRALLRRFLQDLRIGQQHPAHALVLVNYGNGSGQALLALARDIADDVREQFCLGMHRHARQVRTDLLAHFTSFRQPRRRLAAMITFWPTVLHPAPCRRTPWDSETTRSTRRP